MCVCVGGGGGEPEYFQKTLTVSELKKKSKLRNVKNKVKKKIRIMKKTHAHLQSYIKTGVKF